MSDTSHAKRTRAAIAVFALCAGVSACSTSEPPPLALALESSQMASFAPDQSSTDGADIVPTSRPDADEATGTVQTANAPVPPEAVQDQATVQTAAAQAAPQQEQPETVVAAAEPAAETGNAATPPPADAAATAAPAEPDQQLAAAPVTPSEPVSERFASPEAKPEPKRNAFLAGLFGGGKNRAAAKKSAGRTATKSTKLALVDPQPVQTKRIISNSPAPALASTSALPGVRADKLFEINHGDGSGDGADIDVNEAGGGSYQVASAAGLARLAPNGLHTQRPGVDVQCLKPELVRVLKTIERKYGRPVVVTSGYRSPTANRRARGAKKSLHMYCAAADIQVEGVSKWALANYLRSMPGRGGVGTYCHTESVHIDIGPERDWNWRCRRRK